jgi:hypothetical protein
VANRLDIVDELYQGSWNARLQLDQANIDERVLTASAGGSRATTHRPRISTDLRRVRRARPRRRHRREERRRLEFSVEPK